MTVRAYVRVSTDDQATNGHGLDAQKSAIQDEAGRRGWTTLRWYVDGGYSGKDLDRPAMRDLLGSVRRGDDLVVAKLDRLSRSLVDFASLMERAQREKWNVIALDLGVDLSTAHGEFLASIMAAVARWERRVIGQRTAEGMAAARAKGRLPGRRCAVPQDVRDRIAADMSAGLTMRQVAAGLMADEVPSASGGATWTAGQVHAALRSDRLEREAAACSGA